MRWASGFATGVVALVCAELIVWAVVVASPYRDAYREFESELPTITRMALSPGWIFGLVAGLALAATGLNLIRRASEKVRATALGVLAVTAIGLALWTAYAGIYPFSQLAGNISAG